MARIEDTMTAEGTVTAGRTMMAGHIMKVAETTTVDTTPKDKEVMTELIIDHIITNEPAIITIGGRKTR